jgi:hypothetical protein
MDDRLERLVDGELAADEYRALLASLDDEPSGWRRCALVFLENQALAGELGAIRSKLDLSSDPDQVAPTEKHDRVLQTRQRMWRQMPVLLAMAASFLAAFALGVVAPRFFSPSEQDGRPSGNFFSAASPDAAENSKSQPGVPHQTLRPIGNLQLVMDGAGGEKVQAGQVPVYEVEQGLEQYLSSNQPALGPEVLELLRQHGFDVQHEQRYFPAPLDDGRQIIVPVDGYQITPVSRKY